MGEFLAAWVEIERLVRERVPIAVSHRGPVMPTLRIVASIARLDGQTLLQFDRLRRMRNNLVHGVELPDPRDLREAAQQLEAIRQLLATSPPNPPRQQTDSTDA